MEEPPDVTMVDLMDDTMPTCPDYSMMMIIVFFFSSGAGKACGAAQRC